MKILRVSSPEPLECRIAPASATTIHLADLDGSSGFEISGSTVGGGLGTSVAIIGDVNNDTFDDFIVGAPNANEGTGAAYVIFGNGSDALPSFDPATLDGTNGFRLVNEGVGDRFGAAVASAGDLNGDGIADMIVGAPNAKVASTTTTTPGIAYVIYGSATGFPAAIDVSTGLNGLNGFKILGGADGDQFGTSLASVGDVDGNGFDDVVIGAPGADAHGTDSGAAYVIFGKTGSRSVALGVSALQSTDGFKINGVANGDAAGSSVAGGGDLNGDGKDDIVIGAPKADPLATDGQAGAVYVVYGRTSAGIPAFPGTVELSALDGTSGFRIDTDVNGINLGASVAIAGDFNGDGIDDLLIGAPNARTQSEVTTGAVTVLYGSAAGFAATVHDGEIKGDIGFHIFGEAQGDNAGTSVAGAGDVNGDGFDDIVIGSVAAGTGGSAKVHVIFGTEEVFSKGLALSKLDSDHGWKIVSDTKQDATGFSVSVGGDVNGDGFNDILIGAPFANTTGGAYVVFGTPVVQANAKTLTFTDPDGDTVTLKLNKGKFGPGDIVLKQSGDGALLEMIDLSGNAGMKNLSLTINVTPAAEEITRGGIGSDGKVNIGLIKALGMDMKKIKVKGDVTQLVMGGGDFGKLGLKLLQVVSLGAGAGNFTDLTPGVEVPNGIKNIKIAGNVDNVDFDIGAPGISDGLRERGGGLEGTKKGLHNIFVGGDMTDSMLRSQGGIGKMRVNGMVKDTNAQVGGAVGAGLGKLLLKGVLDGATFNVAGSIGSMKMTKDISDTTFTVGGGIKGVIINENVTNSSIGAVGRIAVLGVGGDVTGSTISSPKGFGTVLVKGDFSASSLLAGYDITAGPVNADVKIGKVTIKGIFTASNIVAGAVPGADGDFATADDALIDGGDGDILSKIASVTIKGGIEGTAGAGDHFGIVAEQVGKVKIGNTFAALTSDAHNDDLLLGSTDDVSVREL